MCPAAFYPGGKLPNESNLTLPAHAACNATTVKDEEWVAAAFALSNPLGGRRQEQWDRAMRALTMARPRGRRLGDAFMDGMLELPTGGGGLPLGTDRITQVLAKIIKGVCSRDLDLLLDGETQWTTRNHAYDAFVEWEAPIFAEVPGRGDIFHRGSVMLAKGFRMETAPTLFHWQVMLAGQGPFFVHTVPRESTRLLDSEIGENDFMKVRWPGTGAPG